MQENNFYSLSFDKLKSWLAKNNLPPTGADNLYNWHYRHKNISKAITDLALKTQRKMAEEFVFYLPEIKFIQEAKDGTVKFLLSLKDENQIEAVLIPFQAKYSLCLSSQVGCAMKCSFCFTGTQGLKRNLSTHEIVGQFIVAWNWLKENRPDAPQLLSVVFMGQGEPLHNFDAVKEACEIFLEKKGISLARLRITISTAGYLPGLLRWVSEMPQVNLALSLHSAIEEKREQLIPLNARYQLKKIMAAIDNIPQTRKQYITYEYLVVQAFNDGIEDAIALHALLHNRPAMVNLIAFNPYPGSKWQRPTSTNMNEFKKMLDDLGIVSTIRSTKGEEILAACGQLKS